jgi:hypothetical protein
VLSAPFGLPSAMRPRREPFGSELKVELLGRMLGPNGAQGRRQLLRANSLKYVSVFANRSIKLPVSSISNYSCISKSFYNAIVTFTLISLFLLQTIMMQVP